VESLEPVCSKNGNFDALKVSLITSIFARKVNRTARATLGEQVLFIVSPKQLKFRKFRASKLPVIMLELARFPQAVATLTLIP
jgi:hypothetical protein